MKWISDPIHQISVSLWTDKGPFLLGLLSYHVQKKTSSFSWSQQAIESGDQWSPFFCPVQQSVYKSKNLPIDFHGLPGFLNDALPDGWGLLVMDKALKRLKVPPTQITPALRLALLEDRSWGALTFKPSLKIYERNTLQNELDLHSLAQEVFLMRDGNLDQVSQELLISAGSPHGARPKLFLSLSDDFKKAQVTSPHHVPGFIPWIVKFAAKEEHKDAPKGEYVYMRLAKMAGLNVTDHKLLRINDQYAFAGKRFDYDGIERHYVHTLGGMLHVSHRDNNLDYTNIAEVLTKLPEGEKSLEEGFRRTCFNALLSVRDDHAKNTSFIKKDNHWALSPAYDLTYMEGPNGYHSMLFAQGSSMDPTISDLLRCASSFHISQDKALTILKDIALVAESFPALAQEVDIDKTWVRNVNKKIQQMSKNLNPKNITIKKKSSPQ